MRAGLVIVKYAQEYAALSTSPARTPLMDWLRQRYPTYRPGRTWNAAAEPTHAQAASPGAALPSRTPDALTSSSQALPVPSDQHHVAASARPSSDVKQSWPSRVPPPPQSFKPGWFPDGQYAKRGALLPDYILETLRFFDYAERGLGMSNPLSNRDAMLNYMLRRGAMFRLPETWQQWLLSGNERHRRRDPRTWRSIVDAAASPEKAANPVLDELAALYKYFEYAKNTYGENLKKMREVSSLYDFMHRNKLDVPQAWKAWLRPPEPVNLPR